MASLANHETPEKEVLAERYTQDRGELNQREG